jgi:prepilin-type N-terminal cleavage/methylation domain-containing protein
MPAPNRSGFTLIELLVVVTIVGILSAIAVPQYFKIVERARVAEALACLETMRGAQERAFLKGGSYWPPGYWVYGDQSGLDVQCPAMKYFYAPNIYGDTSGWAWYLYRNTSVPVYGQYYIMKYGGGYEYVPLQCSQWSSSPDYTTPCMRDLLGY